MKILFLDIDGVLNDRKPTSCGFCGIQADKAEQLNRILDAQPTLKLWLTSAWRYLLLTKQMTGSGFENLLLTHGVWARNRLGGWLAEDGPKGRAVDILEAVESLDLRSPGRKWAVLDDLALKGLGPHFHKTESTVGLTKEIADGILKYFNE